MGISPQLPQITRRRLTRPDAYTDDLGGIAPRWNAACDRVYVRIILQRELAALTTTARLRRNACEPGTWLRQQRGSAIQRQLQAGGPPADRHCRSNPRCRDHHSPGRGAAAPRIVEHRQHSNCRRHRAAPHWESCRPHRCVFASVGSSSSVSHLA